MPKKTACIVLAAGQGTRMRSRLPKVLHEVAYEPMIVHVVRAAEALACEQLVVVVSPKNHADVQACLQRYNFAMPIAYAEQAEPRGTGDAAKAGMQAVDASMDEVLLLYGDVPMLRTQTLQALLAARGEAAMSVLGATLADPTGYGRLVRIDARDPRSSLQKIVEHKDCSEPQRQIREINSGIYCIEAMFLRGAVEQLTPNNAQGEYYLTDVVAMAAARGPVHVTLAEDADEARGVNSRIDLGETETYLRRRLVAWHQARGVTFVAPDTVLLAPRVSLGQDVTIGPGVQLLGQTVIGDGASIEGPSVIIDSIIEADAIVHSFSHLERASLGPQAQAGPYARLRPGARLEATARVGNFVEVKNSTLQRGAKANHLTYIGDAEVGERANIGAGTITCNYDGFHKHKTRIGAGAFVGSNNTLIAPIDIGQDAITAAGSTLTEDVPDESLALGRARQTTLAGRARALREKLA